MKGFSILRYAGMIAGFTSTAFFGLLFFTFLQGHAVTFYESNLVIAGGEFAFAILGFLGLIAQLVKMTEKGA